VQKLSNGRCWSLQERIIVVAEREYKLGDKTGDIRKSVEYQNRLYLWQSRKKEEETSSGIHLMAQSLLYLVILFVDNLVWLFLTDMPIPNFHPFWRGECEIRISSIICSSHTG
jgi:hypothetical protein